MAKSSPSSGKKRAPAKAAVVETEDIDVDSMSVRDLKTALRERGQDTNGLKADLVDRWHRCVSV